MLLLLLGLSIVLICLPVDNFKLLNLINIIYIGLFLLGIFDFLVFVHLKKRFAKKLACVINA